MELRRIAAATQALAATRSRLAKRAIIADVLHDATAQDVEVSVSYLSGALRQRRTGLGWRSLREVPPPAAEPSLTVADVDAAMTAIGAEAGPGSATRRSEHVRALFARATAPEQALLCGLVAGELRQGALEAQVQEGLAEAYGVEPAAVRRAAMLLGSTPEAALRLVRGGLPALQAVSLRVGVAVQPMLAASAPDVAAAMERRAGPVAIDAKLDGIRLQVHKLPGDGAGPQVRLFTRSLDEVTARMPEVVAEVAALPHDRLVLDAEALLVDGQGRPEPFQEIAARTATRAAPVQSRLSLFAFDLLHVDDTDLLDAPLARRLAALEHVLPARLRVPRLVTADVAAAESFFAKVIGEGYEGVVVKDLHAPYAAGRRNAGWIKVKPRHTFDLVVLAAEWGHGRRQGWLSNLHLGARADDGDGFVMLGKTFKGLTDELLAWQTKALLAREVRRTPGVVWVAPTLVVEIACDGLQRSPRYPGGVALRFARVLRYREDKLAVEADTLGTLTALLPVRAD